MKHYLLYTVFFFLLLSSVNGQDAIYLRLAIIGGLPLQKETKKYYAFANAWELNLKQVNYHDYDDHRRDNGISSSGLTFGVSKFNKRKNIVFPQNYKYSNLAIHGYMEFGYKYTFRAVDIGIDIGVNAIADHGNNGIYSDTIKVLWDASISPRINYNLLIFKRRIEFFNKIQLLLFYPLLSTINLGISFPICKFVL